MGPVSRDENGPSAAPEGFILEITTYEADAWCSNMHRGTGGYIEQPVNLGCVKLLGL